VGFLFAERRQIYFSKIQHAAQLTTDFGMSSFANALRWSFPVSAIAPPVDATLAAEIMRAENHFVTLHSGR